MHVHWHDGLFLQPHHLQSLQNAVFDGMHDQRKLSMGFSYGVIEAQLSADELNNGHVRFDSLQVAMPRGAVFRYPQEADLPSLDIRAELQKRPEGLVVGLALPIWQRSAPNSIPVGEDLAGPARRVRYRAIEAEVADENSGANKQFVQYLKHNGRLAFGHEQFEDTEFLPLLRILQSSSEDTRGPRMADPRFVPATLLLRGSDVLFRLVRDLNGQVSATRMQLAEQLAASPLDLRLLQGAQFEQMARLRCLTRSSALLNSLLDDSPTRTGCAGRCPTFEAYLAMQDLLAELASLYVSKRVVKWEPYNHDDPWPCFADLDEKIRAFLNPMGAHYRRITFALENGIFYGQVPAGFFKDITGCFLSIEGAQDATTLSRMVENRDYFKLLPASFVEELAIRGLQLKEERSLPADLPLRAGQYYYKVDGSTSAHVWERFIVEPRAAVHFQAPDLTRYKLSLYVTLPPPRP